MAYSIRFIPIAVGLLVLASSPTSASYLISQIPLDPTGIPGIPKYQDPLPEPKRISGKRIKISMSEFDTQILPQAYYGTTRVYGYGKSYPGPTIEAQRHRPTTVTWNNRIDYRDSLIQQLVSIDQTLHWSDPLRLGCHMDKAQAGCFEPYSGPVPAVAHLHGGEVPSAYDGGPDSWYTKRHPGFGVLRGPGFVTKTFEYPNTQEAATLWYHDHGLGQTRLNVYSGMSGFYLLRDWEQEPANLPGGPDDCRRGHGHGGDDDDDDHRYVRHSGHDDDDDDDHKRKHRGNDCPYEREIVIQDRLFDTNAQLIFPDNGNNPDIHPFWRPAFQGNVIVVNGKSWPYMEVEPRRYRLRLLNGSNSRGYRLRIQFEEDQTQFIPIWQIGTDGALLDRPVPVITPGGPIVTLAPGERADVIVDFAGLPPGQNLLIRNVEPNADPNTTGQVMQLRVKHLTAKDRSFDPSKPGARLRSEKDTIPRIDPAITGRPADNVRLLALTGVGAAGGPQAILLNNSTWIGKTTDDPPVPILGSERIGGATDDRLPYTTELPEVGSTEIWRFVNATTGGHPIHLHLAQFQVLDRTKLVDPLNPDSLDQAACYRRAYFAAFGTDGFKPFNGPPFDYNTPNDDQEIGGNPAIPAECLGGTSLPAAWEDGWKDTVRVPANTVTRIAVRWAPTDLPSMTGKGTGFCPKGDVLLDHKKALPCVPRAGSNLFAFDPSAGLDVKEDDFGYPGGPGYVWHCHILDHEDNEMMRALFVKNEHDHKRQHKHRHKHGHKD